MPFLVCDNINSGVDTHVRITVVVLYGRAFLRETCDALMVRDNINSDVEPHVGLSMIDLYVRYAMRIFNSITIW